MNKSIITIGCLLIIFFVFSQRGYSEDLFSIPLDYAQNNNKEATDSINLKKNSIYLTGGTMLLAAAGNLNYERVILTRPDALYKTIRIKFGFGMYIEMLDYGKFITTASLVGLTGVGNNHFELSCGIVGKTNIEWTPLEPWDSGKRTRFLPSGAIGYRFQKPGKPYLFRTGVSYPDFAYVSFGFSF